MIGTTSFDISDKIREIFSVCRSCWNVASYKWKVHNLKIEIISFVVKFNPLSLSISRCKSRYEADLAVYLVSFISSLMG
jgi:thymidine kinase